MEPAHSILYEERKARVTGQTKSIYLHLCLQTKIIWSVPSWGLAMQSQLPELHMLNATRRASHSPVIWGEEYEVVTYMKLNDLDTIILCLIKVQVVTLYSRSSCLIGAYSTNTLIYWEYLWISATGTKNFKIRIASLEYPQFIFPTWPPCHPTRQCCKPFYLSWQWLQPKINVSVTDFSALPVSVGFQSMSLL